MEKLSPFTKKTFLAYVVTIAIFLVCAIYLSATIAIYERNGWDYFIFSKSAVIVVPTALAITMFIMRKIDLASYPNASEDNAKKGKLMLFIIALILNAFLLFAAAHLGAKLYNIHGPQKETLTIEGKIISTYNMNAVKAKRKRKRSITVFDNAQQREFKFKVKKKYETNTLFKETMNKGSLGFLYKRD